MNKLFIISILALLIIPGVLGLTTDVYFDGDPTITAKTIYESESADVTTFAFTTSAPVSGNILLRSMDGTFSTVLDTFNEAGSSFFASYSDVITIDYADYVGYGAGCGNFEVVIQANDGIGDSEYDTASLTVTCDYPPTFSFPASLSLTEDSGTNNDLIDIDDYVADVEDTDAQLTVTLDAESNVAVVDCSLDTDRTLDCMAMPGQSGTSTLTFTAIDTFGNSVTDTLDIIVVPNNDVVVADIPDVTFAEDTSDSSIDLDNYVSDVETVDADIIWTYTGNTNIMVNINPTTRVVTFSAPADWSGSETVTFTAEDEDGSTASDDVLVTVTADNDAPIVTPLSVTFAEDTTFTVQLDDYVADVETTDANMNWVFSGATNIMSTYNTVTREVTFSALADWNGNEVFTMTATDEGGISTGAAVNVTITPVNDAPTLAAIPDQTATETVVFTLSVVANDVDGDTLLYSDDTNLFDIDGNGAISFMPTLADVGVHTITISVTDGLETVSQTFDLEIVEFNLPPTVTITQPADGATLVTGTAYDFMAYATDPNAADVLTYDWDFGDGDSATTAQYAKTYATGGAYTVSVVANDSVLTDADSINVNVLELGFDVTSSVFSDDQFSVAQTTFNRNDTLYLFVSVDETTTGTPVSGLTQDITMYASANGLGVVTLQPYNGVVGGVTIVNGEPATPDGNYYYYIANIPLVDENLGGNDITVVASNTTHAGSTMSSITVLNNDVVVSSLPNMTFDEDTTATLALDAYVSDVETADADLLWNVTGNVNINVVIDPVTHVATFSAPADWHGVEPVVFTVDDTDGSVESIMITVTVVSVNDAPYINLTNVTLAEDTSLMIALDDYVTDDDLAPSSLIWAGTSSAHVTVAIDAGLRTANFTPVADWHGQEYVTLIVDDGNLSSSVNVLVNVTPVNDVPVLSAIDSQNATEMQLFFLQAIATDADFDVLTFSDNTPMFDIDPLTGIISFIPSAADVGTHAITITVTDGTASVSESFILDIAPAFVPPIAIIDSPVDNSLILVNETAKFSALSSYDPDGGDIIQYTWDFGDGNVIVTAEPIVELVFKELMTRTVTLTVLDDDDRTATATATFSVVPYIGDCMDGRDNDGDGLVDMEDPGCASPHSYSEFNYDMSSIEEGVKVSSISVSGSLGEGYAVPGDTLTIRILAENDAGAGLDDLRFGITIPDLGIKRKSSSFHMSSGQRHSKSIVVFLPEDVMPGEYDVEITVTNDDIRRSLHRWIEIVE